MNLDPGLHQPGLRARQSTSQQFATVDGELRLLALILGVDMGQVVLLGIEEIHSNQNAVETADRGHDGAGSQNRDRSFSSSARLTANGNGDYARNVRLNKAKVRPQANFAAASSNRGVVSLMKPCSVPG